MRNARVTTTVLVSLIACAAVQPQTRADWPCFLGPNYDGISDETGFKKDFTESPKVLWERNVGEAFSSFAHVGGKLYTCGTKDGRQVLYCLNAMTGDIVWEKPFEEEFPSEHGGGTRATPVVNDGMVYVLGAHGTLLGANAETGETVWDKKFSNKPTWAYSGSVLVEGNLVITTPGKQYGALAAYDKKTGKPVWKCANDPPSYATPYPFSFNGKRYVVGFMSRAALIADVETGREVWRTKWKTDWDINAAMPIFHDGYLFLSSGYKTGAGLFKMTASGDRLVGDEVWKSKVLLNKFQSCILHEGKLYTSDQKALKCVDFMTGEEAWNVPRVKHGTVVFADGHLIVLTEGGELQIGKASPDGFSPTTKVDILDGRCWTVPVLQNGLLYARNLERIVCLDLRG